MTADPQNAPDARRRMSAVERLSEMRARAEAATRGPWQIDHPTSRQIVAPEVQTSRVHLLREVVLYDDGPSCDQDAEFIAHARTDLPLLAKVVEDVLALCDKADAKPGPDGERHVNTVVLRALIEERLGGGE